MGLIPETKEKGAQDFLGCSLLPTHLAVPPEVEIPKEAVGTHLSLFPECLYLVKVGLSVTGQKSSPLECSGLGRDRPRGRLSASISALNHHRVQIFVPLPAQRKAGIWVGVRLRFLISISSMRQWGLT